MRYVITRDDRLVHRSEINGAQIVTLSATQNGEDVVVQQIVGRSSVSILWGAVGRNDVV